MSQQDQATHAAPVLRVVQGDPEVPALREALGDLLRPRVLRLLNDLEDRTFLYGPLDPDAQALLARLAIHAVQ